MDYVELFFVKMSSRAVIPTRATEHSVGLDFYSPSDYIYIAIVHKGRYGVPLYRNYKHSCIHFHLFVISV